MKQLDYLLPPKLSGQGFLSWLQEIFGWADSRFTEIEGILSGNNDSPLGKLATPPPVLPKRPSISWFKSWVSWISERIKLLRAMTSPEEEVTVSKRIEIVPSPREEILL